MTTTPTARPPRTVFRVTELNGAVRDLLEQSFGLLWVEGEISNLARPRSGHMYFSLKDDAAQVRCALFRGKARLVNFDVAAGDQVLVRAGVSLYPARGDYQLIVEHMELAGAGALQRAFEQLKARLDAEGLFDAELKRALPAVPRRIGVITSATGAALRDVLSVLSRRYPLGAARVYPVPVQGAAAPAAIVDALTRAGARADCDVLLLVRGGGSIEDLQAFNDEAVARAIRACAIPVISGVGHEVDITIADFAADVRAPTPSAAAELVCPDLAEWRQRVDRHLARLTACLGQKLTEAQQQQAGLSARLARQHPRRRLEAPMQRLDEAEARLTGALRQRLERAGQRRAQAHGRLFRAAPDRAVARQIDVHRALERRLNLAMRRLTRQTAQRLGGAARALNAVSPLQTLDRGYAIARAADGSVLRSAEHVATGDAVSVTLRRDRLECRITSIQAEARQGRLVD